MPFSGEPMRRRILLKIFLLCLLGHTGLASVALSISYEEEEQVL